MGSRKRPRDETIDWVVYKCFQHKAWGMLIVTNSIVVIIWNSLILPITEEVRECTGHASIQIENLLRISYSDEWLIQELKDKGNYQSVIQKSDRRRLQERSLKRAFNYREKVTIQMVFHNVGQN